MSLKQHALMQDTGNQNALIVPPVKHDMSTVFVAEQAGTDMDFPRASDNSSQVRQGNGPPAMGPIREV
jgi:hypothetical protein